MKRKCTPEASVAEKKSKKKTFNKNGGKEGAGDKNNHSLPLKSLKNKRKIEGESSSGSSSNDADSPITNKSKSIYSAKSFNQKDETNLPINRDLSESPSDLQPLQYLKNSSSPKSETTKQKKGKKRITLLEHLVESFAKPGVLKNSKLKHSKNIPEVNGGPQENSSPLLKKIKKKVRIDETESLKYKREIAESEHHFTKKELPAKIIKSKLNKNLTEEVKVNKTKTTKPPIVNLLESSTNKTEDFIDDFCLAVPQHKNKGKTIKKEKSESPCAGCNTLECSCSVITIKSEDSNSSNKWKTDPGAEEICSCQTLPCMCNIKNENNSFEAEEPKLEVALGFDVDNSSSGESDLEVYYINKRAEKEAELKLKQSQSELKKNGVQLMPKEDQLLLAQRIEEFIPEGDTKSYTYRLQNIDWSKIAFRNYSLEDCQKVWGLLLKKVRHYRLLSEITHDIKNVIELYDMKKSKKTNKHPEMPKRPLSSYFLFYIRKRDKVRREHPNIEAIELNKFISEMFQNLPAEKKQKYEMLAAKNREEYKIQMEEFYTRHPEFRKVAIKREPKERKEKPPTKPENPYRLFMQSELEREEIAEEDKAEFKEVCREKWRQMPDSKKLDWILQAEKQLVQYEEELKEYMSRHPEYTPKKMSSKPFLSRQEQNLKEKLAGKPKKPPTSAYSLFVSLTIQSNDAQDIPSRERWAYTSAKWKAMTEAEKDQYKILLTQVTEQYQKEFKTYLDSLPEEKRQEEILKNLPKRREKKKKARSTSSVSASSGPSCSGLGQFVFDDRDQPSTSRGVRPKSGKGSGPKGSKTKQKVPYPVPPPRSAYKYFSEKHKGPNPKEAWKSLSCTERRQYNKELDVIKDKYIQDFETYLKSLDRDELSVFCANRNTQEEEYSSSDPSESESEEEEESSSDEVEDEVGNLSSDED
ncbi:nucleolar transcription factor 1-A-like [Anthonomus grandis grandis]|uniref:nucleolar transcription factor 1-A-like n=1 Tax=Anthonomus grandis grandis TaxID=2921223 RepID=UPI00216620AD|nr:nucleolar transcription factor 1-A-like [Anthonomus grandis grandis]